MRVELEVFTWTARGPRRWLREAMGLARISGEKTVWLREAKWPDQGHTAGRWPLRKEGLICELVSGGGDPKWLVCEWGVVPHQRLLTAEDASWLGVRGHREEGRGVPTPRGLGEVGLEAWPWAVCVNGWSRALEAVPAPLGPAGAISPGCSEDQGAQWAGVGAASRTVGLALPDAQAARTSAGARPRGPVRAHHSISTKQRTCPQPFHE